MDNEKVVCPKCGGDEFYASQYCRGSITVIVDGTGGWLRNVEEGAEIAGLDFDNPDNVSELCVKCEDVEDTHEQLKAHHDKTDSFRLDIGGEG